MAATNITVFKNDNPDRPKSINLVSKTLASGNWHYVTIDPGRKYQIIHTGYTSALAFATGILKVKYQADASPAATTVTDEEENVMWIGPGGNDNPIIVSSSFSIQSNAEAILFVIKEIEVGKFGGEANG